VRAGGHWFLHGCAHLVFSDQQAPAGLGGPFDSSAGVPHRIAQLLAVGQQIHTFFQTGILGESAYPDQVGHHVLRIGTALRVDYPRGHRMCGDRGETEARHFVRPSRSLAPEDRNANTDAEPTLKAWARSKPHR